WSRSRRRSCRRRETAPLTYRRSITPFDLDPRRRRPEIHRIGRNCASAGRAPRRVCGTRRAHPGAGSRRVEAPFDLSASRPCCQRSNTSASRRRLSFDRPSLAMVAKRPPVHRGTTMNARKTLFSFPALALLGLLALPAAARAANSWVPLGPDLINNGQAWPGRVPVTGRINVVAPNPFNPLGDVWVGSAGGGVWHGTVWPNNFWDPMTDGEA